jgi:hypothetical protein
VYVPPHKLKEQTNNLTDHRTEKFQRLQWDALRKSVNGLINKVNTGNIKNIIPEIFNENLVRTPYYSTDCNYACMGDRCCIQKSPHPYKDNPFLPI